MRSNLMRFLATLITRRDPVVAALGHFRACSLEQRRRGLQGCTLRSPPGGHSPLPPACAAAVPDPKPWKQPEARWTAQAVVQACTPPAVQSSGQ